VFQEFTLTGKPLTHVSAPTPSGGKSTLRIRVDGVLWTEVASFFGQSPKATVYIARLADDGTVTVRFGDGRTGAVLPTGQDNIVATYRVGTGRGGNLDQGRISLLLTRPLGVEEVINPIAATGGDDPEQLAKAKQNAPATVLTLDRVVSLRDYEDFARSFAGIGKARANPQWNGEQRIVRLVVAAEDGAPVDPSSALFTNLRDGIDAARHAGHQVVIDPFHPRPFLVALGVTVTPDRLAADVFAAVTASLNETFSFERRDFGQRVAASEVLATVQAVPGVRGAVLTALHFTETPAQRVELLPAEAADLLTLAGVDLTELLEPLP
jgi:predicted phage baseplate assembly protein